MSNTNLQMDKQLFIIFYIMQERNCSVLCWLNEYFNNSEFNIAMTIVFFKINPYLIVNYIFILENVWRKMW